MVRVHREQDEVEDEAGLAILLLVPHPPGDDREETEGYREGREEREVVHRLDHVDQVEEREEPDDHHERGHQEEGEAHREVETLLERDVPRSEEPQLQDVLDEHLEGAPRPSGPLAEQVRQGLHAFLMDVARREMLDPPRP